MPRKDIYILGTGVKITTVLSLDSPDTVKITIEDPSGNEKISRVNMTLETGSLNVYSYVFQSDDDYDSGFYTVIIEATKSIYTSMKRGEFEMADATASWSTRH